MALRASRDLTVVFASAINVAAVHAGGRSPNPGQPSCRSPMPYFQRKPIEGLTDLARLQGPVAGLASRGPARGTGLVGTQATSAPAPMTGIVKQAAAVLSSERPNVSPGVPAGSAVAPVTTQSARISQLQDQVNGLIDQLVAIASRPTGLDVAAPQSAILTALNLPSDSAHLTVEPAPVLAPEGPVAPGDTGRIRISLVNEDEQPAPVAFYSTGLIGEDGMLISAERVSFQPHELVLSPGKTGEVIVSVSIPTQTRCGVYSGLVRASKLDYLHAVLVLQVEYP